MAINTNAMGNKTRIVVSVDIESDVDQPSLKRAMQLGRALQADIRLVYCQIPRSKHNRRFYGEIDTQDIQQAEQDAHQEEIDRLIRRLSPQEFSIEGVVEIADSESEGLIQQVKKYEADFVVKSTTIHGKIFRTLFSHTDWHLMRHCPVPVWLAKNIEWASDSAIVACVDPDHPDDPDSILDGAIVRQAQKLSDNLNAPLQIVHVQVPLSNLVKPLVMDSVIQNSQNEHNRLVEAFLESVQLPAENFHHFEGYFEDQLPDIVQRLHGGLVVMGVIARRGIDKILLGSSAERVLDRIPCDILVVKPEQTYS